MTLTFGMRKGDVLSAFESNHFDALIHGCNIHNTMGAGIAAIIARNYPQAELADQRTPRADRNKLGTFSLARVKRESIYGGLIFNLYTQETFSQHDEDVFQYGHFAHGLHTILRIPGMTFGMPMIGCGLAGGDREKILAIIDSAVKRYNANVIVYTL